MTSNMRGLRRGAAEGRGFARSDIAGYEEKLAVLLEVGLSVRRACGIVGLPYPTYKEWMRRGERRGEFGEEGEGTEVDAEGVYERFALRMRAAEGALEKKLVTTWVDAAQKEWQAAKELLARRFPNEWANVEVRKIEGELGGGEQMTLELIWGDENADADQDAEIVLSAEDDPQQPGALQGGGSGAALRENALEGGLLLGDGGGGQARLVGGPQLPDGRTGLAGAEAAGGATGGQGADPRE